MKLKPILILTLTILLVFSSLRINAFSKDSETALFDGNELSSVPLTRSIGPLLFMKASSFQSELPSDLEEKKKNLNEDDSEEETLDTIPISFYIITLVLIILAGYFMNKRKPLLNQ